MFGFGCFDRLAYKKPQSIFRPLTRASYACFRLLLRASPSAHSSFLLDAFTTYTNGWIGRGTGVSPREDNLVGLVASLQSRQGYRLAVHTLAAEPPGLPGQASELYYEKIR